ncbi:hypothetical protein RJ639_007454 [Escallonia herrerae]|uniref:Transposase MuDR plant domain-containing protein n=1 Tax=Escallonia herrerae TaxID=1293975 RepID=A0AA88VY47_9ASTE|nr:hypothetical protein RJ639_007454 [Escallonia herrerae]
MKRPKYHEFVKVSEKDDLVFKLGIKFGSVEDLKKAIRQHAILNGKDILFKRSDRYRVRAQPGRPKKARKRQMDEQQSTGTSKATKLLIELNSVTCSNCGKIGHNRRSYILREDVVGTSQSKGKEKIGQTSDSKGKGMGQGNSKSSQRQDSHRKGKGKRVQDERTNKSQNLPPNQSSNRPGQVHVTIVEEVVQPRITAEGVSIRPPSFTFQGRRYMTKKAVEAAARKVRILRSRGRDAAKKPWK